MGRLWWGVVVAVGIGLVLLILNDQSGTTLGLDNDDFGHLLYLGAFGAIVATGIVGSGMRFGEVARNLALWMLVIFVFVAGYQYRYELQDVASRVTAGLVPGSPLSVTEADGRVSVMIDKGRNGHFDTRAEVNGEPVRFMIDTGATNTVLAHADAVAAGLDVEALRFDIPVSTANGVAYAARATVDEIRIGKIVRQRQTVYVAAPGRLDQSLLGMSFLSTLAGYNVRGDRLVLID